MANTQLALQEKTNEDLRRYVQETMDVMEEMNRQAYQKEQALEQLKKAEESPGFLSWAKDVAYNVLASVTSGGLSSGLMGRLQTGVMSAIKVQPPRGHINAKGEDPTK